MFAILYFVICINRLSFALEDYMIERVQNDGIDIERFSVITEDGYILSLYHLMRPLDSPGYQTPAKPMLFMHGLFSSSLDFIAYRNISAGYYFFDRNYDVWMGNVRGNRFSRNHITLDPEHKEFWQFTWHEIGVYDLPAMIDTVLMKTNQNQLNYVGHSQGGSILAVLLSERTEYNGMISSAHLIAPAIILKHYNPVFHPFLKHLNGLKLLTEKYKYFEAFPYKSPKNKICTIASFVEICKFMYELLLGPFAPHSYYDGFFVDFAYTQPNGASYLQLLHYGQIAKSGRFQKFDFGPSKNLEWYGTVKPPEYNLSNVQTNVHLMYGTNDDLVRPENFPIVINKMRDSIVAISRLDRFNHNDFVYGRQAHIVPPIILRVIQKLSYELIPFN